MKEYYTIKEIADLIEVSKTAIQNAIKAADIDYDKKERNKFYYGAEKTKLIISKIRPDFNLSNLDNSTSEIDNQSDNSTSESNDPIEKNENSTSKTDNQSDNSQTRTDNQYANKTEPLDPLLEQQLIKELQRTISIFETELKEKNEQLKIKDKQIEALSNTIQNLNDTIQGQLYINAQEKQLIEANSSGKTKDKNQKEEKKSFFRRIFGKND